MQHPHNTALILLPRDKTPSAAPFVVEAVFTTPVSEGSLLLEAEETPPSSLGSSVIAGTGDGVNPRSRESEPDEMALLLLLQGEGVFVALGTAAVSVASGAAVGLAVGLAVCSL